jgi:hypothetical protein
MVAAGFAAMSIRWLLGWVALLGFFSAAAQAHKASDAYLTLRVDPGSEIIYGQWDIALRDLSMLVDIDIDANDDHLVEWGELKHARAAIDALVIEQLSVATDDGHCPMIPDDLMVDQHSDGGYAVLIFTLRCTKPLRSLDIDYRLLSDIDAGHRGLLHLSTPIGSQSAVLVPGAAQHFDLQSPSPLRNFAQYAHEGVWHIWTGYDHLLFLVALLLPAVLRRVRHEWVAAVSLRAATWRVASVVTAFTLAHSITLTLAALHVVSLPSRLVESSIALSVVLAALNNIRPMVTERTWAFAFGFGLLHGFGFAGALADLGLPRSGLALCLFAFNVVVELGQLAVLAAVLPLAFALRTMRFYRRNLLYGGSALIALLAAIWMTERLFDVRVL